MSADSPPVVPFKRSKLERALRSLYVQVLIGITLGCLAGYWNPDLSHWFPMEKPLMLADALKPLGDGFIKLVKMLIAPIIFTTVVTGIGTLGDLKKVGRVGLKAILYFEVVTTLALMIGLIVVNVVRPGEGINANPASLDASQVSNYASTAAHHTTTDFILNVIPKTFVDAFVSGEILQVLLVAVLSGVALSLMGQKSAPLLGLLHDAGHMFMKILGMIMHLAPIAAFGAMAFTIGKFGLDSLVQLASLLACVYVTCIAFVIFVLGGIMWSIGFNIFKFLRYIREELLLVLGTSSSESALPAMLVKMERLGCDKAVVGLVLPTGYSFNLDGTSIYLTMAAIFVAQATNTPLTLGQQISVLLVLLLTSKGAAAVTGGGFVTLSATLSATQKPGGGGIPVAGLALLLGIDRFMSEARAITNLIGNGVATLFIANWEGALDRDRAKKMMDSKGAHEIES